MLPGVVAGCRRGRAAGRRRSPRTGVTYARKLAREEGRLDFAEPAEALERRAARAEPVPRLLVRGARRAAGPAGGRVVAGGAASPGTVIGLPLTVACGEAALEVTLVQRAGRRPMTPDELQRGFPLPVGTRLG